MFCVPLAAFAPDQSPLAVHDVGLLVADHVIVEPEPINILVGLTVSETAGAFGMTRSAAVSLVDPAALEHSIVNV